MPEAPKIIRLETVRGSNEPIYLQLNLNDCHYDTTSASAVFTVKRSFEETDAQALFQKTTTANTVKFLDPPSGLVKIIMLAADTNTLPMWFQDFYFDFKLTDVNGIIVYFMQGTLGVYPSITRS